MADKTAHQPWFVWIRWVLCSIVLKIHRVMLSQIVTKIWFKKMMFQNIQIRLIYRHIVNTTTTHTCCIGLLNSTDMRKNGGTDDRPIEWPTLCAKLQYRSRCSCGIIPRHDWFTVMNRGHVVIKGHNCELCKNGWTDRDARQTRVMSFQTRCWYSIHPHMLYRPIEWPRHAQERRNRC